MRRLVIALIFSSTLAFGQTRAEFEVASIRPAGEQIQGVAVGLHIDGAQAGFTYLSVRDYIVMAYRLKPIQVIGPDWMSSQRFNISAKLPEGATQDQVPQMLQTLLADRFQMKMHREMREFPVYALGAAKSGFKLTPLPPDPDLDVESKAPVNIAAGGNATGVGINLGKGQFFNLTASAFEVKKLDMRTFADMLTRFEDRPVVDMTDLKGRYDFNLELTPEDRTALLIRAGIAAGAVLPPQALRALDFGSNDSLIQSLQKIGLTFEAQKAPLEVLVVDTIQKTPSEN